MKKKSSGNRSDRRKRPNSSAVKGEKITRMFDFLVTAHMVSASRPLAERIFEQFQDVTSAVGRQSARLYYDSGAIPSAAGMRPSLVSERRLKYMVGRSVIELSVTPVFPGRFELTGRIDDLDPKEAAVITLKGRRQQKAEIDEFGFFSFSGVAPGVYSLEIKIGDSTIAIQKLDLG